LFSAFVAMILFSLFNAMVSVVLYVIFNGFMNNGQVVVAELPYFHLQEPIVLSASFIPFFVVGVFLCRGLFDFASNYMMSVVGLRAVMNIRNELYFHVTRQSMGFFTKGRTGDMISRIMMDVGHVQAAITSVIVDIVKQPLTIIFNVLMAFHWGGKLAFVSLVIFPLVSIPIILLGRQLRRIVRKMQERMADITSIMEETITGIRIVKAFNMEAREVNKFKDANKRVFNFFKKMLKVTVIQRPLVEVLGAIGAATAIWFGMQYLPADRFVAFIGAMFILYEPLKKLSKVNSSIQQAVGAGERIFEIIDHDTLMQDKPSAIEFNQPIESIEFDNVSFGYHPDKEVLKGINLKVCAGEVIAIVGPSGSGKTTLISLLARFYDVDKGSIRINGQEISDYTVRSVRGQVGIVSQETTLFNDSIRDNIAYGKPEATQEEVLHAAKMAHADSFIRQMPNGYDTSAGEKGYLLSGGQRQRLAIARAILKNPPILILDEATSQLDMESEREVQKALENLMQGKTVFVIAHRLATVQKADRILVLENGQIVQEGNNESLLQEGGIYRRLYDLQFNI